MSYIPQEGDLMVDYSSEQDRYFIFLWDGDRWWFIHGEQYPGLAADWLLDQYYVRVEQNYFRKIAIPYDIISDTGTFLCGLKQEQDTKEIKETL